MRELKSIFINCNSYSYHCVYKCFYSIHQHLLSPLLLLTSHFWYWSCFSCQKSGWGSQLSSLAESWVTFTWQRVRDTTHITLHSARACINVTGLPWSLWNGGRFSSSESSNIWLLSQCQCIGPRLGAMESDLNIIIYLQKVNSRHYTWSGRRC